MITWQARTIRLGFESHPGRPKSSGRSCQSRFWPRRPCSWSETGQPTGSGKGQYWSTCFPKSKNFLADLISWKWMISLGANLRVKIALFLRVLLAKADLDYPFDQLTLFLNGTHQWRARNSATGPELWVLPSLKRSNFWTEPNMST